MAPNGGALGIGTAYTNTHFGKIEWTGVPTGNAVNELRLGLFQDRISGTAGTSQLSTGDVGISIAGVTVGATDASPSLLSERRVQLVDTLRVTSYSHTATFGIDVLKTRDLIDDLANSGGTYIYPSLTAFAQDFSGGGLRNNSMFTQTIGDSRRNLHTTEFGIYAQDAWQATRRLRLTAGVRWQKPFLPQPTEQDATYYQAGSIPSPFINADPRIGVSYMFNERTVLRAGWGMYHAPMTGELLDALFLGNGIYQTAISATRTQSGAPLFPSLVAADKIRPGMTNLMFASPKLRDPYTQQSTLAIERNLGGGSTLTVSYIDSRGIKLWTAEDLNLADPTKTGSYSIYNDSAEKVGTFVTSIWSARSTSSYAHVYQIANGGSSWYRALAFQFRKPMWHGLSLEASYTWSHAIDDTGGPVLAGGIPLNSYNLDNRNDLGSSATDQRHRAVVDWMWRPKLVSNRSPAARCLLNGWEISSIATLASSQPATATVLVNGQQFSNVSMAYTTSLNGSDGWSRVPFLPVNSLYSDPRYTVDARLARTLPFTERVKGRLIFEAFNVFNTQYDTGVNTVAYVATGGLLKPVAQAGGQCLPGLPGRHHRAKLPGGVPAHVLGGSESGRGCWISS